MGNLELLRYSEIKTDILVSIFRQIVEDYLKISQKPLKNFGEIDKDEIIIRGLKENLITFYPNVEEWSNKILKEIKKNNKKRELFFALIFNKVGIELAGILILKNMEDEKKICTLQVIEKFKNNGIAKELLKKSFEYLGTETPLMTLPEECYENGFKFLLRKYKFKITNKILGFYRPNKIEYFFNEVKE